jgi:hypothetical protein
MASITASGKMEMHTAITWGYMPQQTHENGAIDGPLVAGTFVKSLPTAGQQFLISNFLHF